MSLIAASAGRGQRMPLTQAIDTGGSEDLANW
jgi:hypothetical protein